MGFSLSAVFGVDASGVRAEMKSLRRDLNDFVQDWAKLGASVAVGAFVALSKGAIELGGHLVDTATNLTLNVESLQALEAQNKRNGVSEEQLLKAVEKTKAAVLAAAAGDEAKAAALEKIHLKASELIKLPLDKQYEAIAKATATAKDEEVAYSAVSELLGEKVGPKLMASLKELGQDGLPGVVKAAREAGQVMDTETVVALDRAGDAIDDFKKRITVAVGNIIVNFRTEEGLELLGMKLLKVVGTFGAGIVDALEEGFNLMGYALGGALLGFIHKFQDGMIDAVEFVARVINKVLPDKFTINIDNLEGLKSAGKSISEEITAAIAMTSPGTFKKEVAAYWDKTIADQQKVVDDLNHTQLGEDAKKLKEAGDHVASTAFLIDQALNNFFGSLDKESKKAADNLSAGAQDVASNITVVADSATEAWNAAVEAADQAVQAAREFAGLVISVNRVGNSYESQSTASLEGVRQRLNDQLNSVSPNSGLQLRSATFTSDYGAAVTASALNAELEAVDKELTLRKTISSYAAQHGEDAARRQFGDTDTDRALRDLQTSSTRTSTAVETIASGLKKGGYLD